VQPEDRVSPWLFVGFAIASIGGPLAPWRTSCPHGGRRRHRVGRARRAARDRGLRRPVRALARLLAARGLARRLDRLRRGRDGTACRSRTRLDLGARLFPLFYDKLLKPSLGALFVSQFLVFIVFPLYKRGLRWLPLVAIACGLAGWGFYTLVSGSAST